MRRYALAWLSLGSWRRRSVLVGGALLVGVVAVLFALGAERAAAFRIALFGFSPWLPLIVTPAGFALMAWASRTWFPGTEGGGIPQTIAAVLVTERAARQRLLSVRIVIGKILLTLGGLACGASIGREGPSVQVGAGIMHALAGRRWLGRVASERNLILAGGAAGVAAAFNAPLAGIMFAIEELSRYRAFQANSTTLASVIFAGLVSIALLGNYVFFGVTDSGLPWAVGLGAGVVSGFAGGLAGGLFGRMATAATRGLPGRVGVWARERPLAFAAGCGALVAVVGVAGGGMAFGTGYLETRAALEAGTPLPIEYGLSKLVATFLSFLSGIPGGIFAPSLAIGAGLGSNLAELMPFLPVSAVMLLMMVAYLSGMSQSPLTSFLVVLELTNNHQMLLPLMAASVVATGVSRAIMPTPLYYALALGATRAAERP